MREFSANNRSSGTLDSPPWLLLPDAALREGWSQQVQDVHLVQPPRILEDAPGHEKTVLSKFTSSVFSIERLYRKRFAAPVVVALKHNVVEVLLKTGINSGIAIDKKRLLPSYE